MLIKMRKFISIMLICVMLTGIVGCSKDTTNEVGDTSSGNSTNTTSTEGDKNTTSSVESNVDLNEELETESGKTEDLEFPFNSDWLLFDEEYSIYKTKNDYGTPFIYNAGNTVYFSIAPKTVGIDISTYSYSRDTECIAVAADNIVQHPDNEEWGLATFKIPEEWQGVSHYRLEVIYKDKDNNYLSSEEESDVYVGWDEYSTCLTHYSDYKDAEIICNLTLLRCIEERCPTELVEAVKNKQELPDMLEVIRDPSGYDKSEYGKVIMPLIHNKGSVPLKVNYVIRNNDINDYKRNLLATDALYLLPGHYMPLLDDSSWWIGKDFEVYAIAEECTVEEYSEGRLYDEFGLLGTLTFNKEDLTVEGIFEYKGDVPLVIGAGTKLKFHNYWELDAMTNVSEHAGPSMPENIVPVFADAKLTLEGDIKVGLINNRVTFAEDYVLQPNTTYVLEGQYEEGEVEQDFRKIKGTTIPTILEFFIPYEGTEIQIKE